MNWRNIKLVFIREVRDQLRDRRTLFMVAVLPLFMYPLLGTSFFQLSQFLKQHAATVVLTGCQQLEDMEGLPPLLEGQSFAESLFPDPGGAKLLKLRIAQPGDSNTTPKRLHQQLREGEIDAVVVFPTSFADKLRDARRQTQRLAAGEPLEPGKSLRPPTAVIQFGAREASQVANLRVRRVLDTWAQRIMQKNLSDGDLPESLAAPLAIQSLDLSTDTQRRAGVWAKLLPFVVFVWALTGAFYPAIDLCAGEKERGTLETLLASPAHRSEIVWGKLLTVICFSIATALLNLASLGATGKFLLGSIESSTGGAAGLGMPPITSLLWLVVALPPIAALFSALSIACASFAKSTKEGQYYFMPLFMAAMPLMLFPMSPGVELNLGNALVPLMGMVLLLRSLIEGQYAEALQYLLPVAVVTLGCCLLAVKWAVYQFNQESVLFREGERFSVGQWLKKLVREPKELPTVGMAVTCIGFVMLLKFFAEIAVVRLQPLFSEKGLLAANVLISQACILLPALLMAIFVVRRTGTALFGKPISPGFTPVGVALAVLMALLAHPVSIALLGVFQQVFPASEELTQALEGLQGSLATVPLWALIFFIGVLPGFCEEVTFRGFVLGGLRSTTPPLWAVLITAVAFGAVHGMLQQSINAAIMGLLLGYLTIRWGTIWPAMAFHVTNNSLLALFTHSQAEISAAVQKTGWRSVLVLDDKGLVSGYHGAVVTLAAVGLVGLLILLELTRPRAATMAHPAE